jgi:hypothetical protein
MFHIAELAIFGGSILTIDIYKSRFDDDKFVSVEDSDNVEKFPLGEIISPEYEELTYFKKSVDLREQDATDLKLDPSDIEEQILRNGYAIHSLPLLQEPVIYI